MTSERDPDRPHHQPSGGDETRPLDDLVHEGDVAMLTSVDGGELAGRPLTVAAVEGGGVSFLVDGTADWVGALAPKAPVNVAVVASGRNDWVSLSGRASRSTDRATVERLWRAPAGAWFDGPDDPRVTVLHVPVDRGSFWSAPGGGPIGRVISVLGAAIGRGDGGEHGHVATDRAPGS